MLISGAATLCYCCEKHTSALHLRSECANRKYVSRKWLSNSCCVTEFRWFACVLWCVPLNTHPSEWISLNCLELPRRCEQLQTEATHNWVTPSSAHCVNARGWRGALFLPPSIQFVYCSFRVLENQAISIVVFLTAIGKARNTNQFCVFLRSALDWWWCTYRECIFYFKYRISSGRSEQTASE